MHEVGGLASAVSGHSYLGQFDVCVWGGGEISLNYI